MRKTAAIPALVVLIVTGCAAEAGESGASSATGTATGKPSASAETVAQDSDEETCRKLLGTEGNGPLREAASLVKIGGGTSGFEGTVETARALHEEIQGVAQDASPEMEPLLEELSSPMENTIKIAENPGSPWTFNADTWRTTVAELETSCAPYRVS
ncbi:hypothetical protein [Arthrobacter sp. zg-Y877]|uniref:hypothetical protein n=1 Tax=Arthrobacter sp. zg-Y877 TaxID=3049074 RepID=UPI0025A31D4C|nr:hypothetical protein [Arthrobacter sp. zg-Y877]MDM7991436.1 hypothetical protein [Arthrobacter sp. zg-Y877]